VKANVAAFGSDPNNVTMAGESAGGMSIGALLTSPQADGLFHRAILQSGSPGLIATKTWSARVHHEFAKHLEADSVDDLNKLTTQQILEAQARLFKSRFSDIAFGPVIDGDVVPVAPIQHLRSASEPTVPILIGTTLDEARYWILEDGRLDQLPISFIQPWLNAITGNRADDIIEAYRQSRPDYTDSQIGLAITGDSAFRMPAIATAEALANSTTPVWMYLFALASTSLSGRLGSPHAIDLPFTFNNLRASGASAFIEPDAADYQPLADTTQGAWINFIRHGDPQTTELGDWPTYDATSRPTMVFNPESGLEYDPFAASHQAWGDVPFDGLTPSIGYSNPGNHEGTRYIATALRMHDYRCSCLGSDRFWTYACSPGRF
jgi:para-nitrobenzyl esterase